MTKPVILLSVPALREKDVAAMPKLQELMAGEGEIEFPPILRTLEEVGYTGGVYVELSRHSHEGPTAARRAFEFLQRIVTVETENNRL